VIYANELRDSGKRKASAGAGLQVKWGGFGDGAPKVFLRQRLMGCPPLRPK